MTYLPGSSVNPVSYWIGRVGELRRGVVAQLDVELVADVLDRDAVVVLHLADEVDQRALRAARAARAPARCRES